MAHEVENMFSVGETPWHGLGRVIKDAPNFDDILKIAGLDWTVSMRPMYVSVNGVFQAVQQRAIMRDSDDSVLGYAGDRYKPYQNHEALDFYKKFYDSGACSFETAGSLRQGAKVWFLAKLNGQSDMDIGHGDIVRKYLLLSNGHDGVTGIRVGFSPIRVVCANTLRMAHNANDSKLIRVFHSNKVGENMELLKETVNLANQSFEATAEQYRKLTKRQVCKADLEKYVDVVFYNGAQAESDREKIARQSLNEDITRLFETGRGADLPTAKGTAWGMYNAVTEYLGYERGRDQEVRLDNLWFGNAQNVNEKALEEALVLAG